jgi:hypothetical protein
MSVVLRSGDVHAPKGESHGVTALRLGISHRCMVDSIIITR